MIERVGKLVRGTIRFLCKEKTLIKLFYISFLLPIIGIIFAIMFAFAVNDHYTWVYKYFENDNRRVGHAAMAILLALASTFHIIRLSCSC